MKQVFVMVAAALAAVAALFVVVGLVLPNRWSVERAVLIHAPASAIHPLVQDLRAWSQWEHAPDPTLSYEYSGAPEGVGATRSYFSRYAGSGSTTITDSDPARGVSFSSKVNSETEMAKATISYVGEGNATRVIWRDEGELPLITGGYLRDSVEDALAQHLDANLNKLKDVAERAAASR